MTNSSFWRVTFSRVLNTYAIVIFAVLWVGFIIALTFFTDVLEKKPAGPPVLPVN